MLLRSSAAMTIPAEFSASFLVRYAFVPIRTKRPAQVKRISLVRIVSRATIGFLRRARSMIKGDADHPTEVVQLSAFLRRLRAECLKLVSRFLRREQE